MAPNCERGHLQRLFGGGGYLFWTSPMSFSIQYFFGPHSCTAGQIPVNHWAIPSALSPDICQRNRLLGKTLQLCNTGRKECYLIVRRSIPACAVLESSDVKAFFWGKKIMSIILLSTPISMCMLPSVNSGLRLNKGKAPCWRRAVNW